MRFGAYRRARARPPGSLPLFPNKAPGNFLRVLPRPPAAPLPRPGGRKAPAGIGILLGVCELGWEVLHDEVRRVFLRSRGNCPAPFSALVQEFARGTQPKCGAGTFSGVRGPGDGLRLGAHAGWPGAVDTGRGSEGAAKGLELVRVRLWAILPASVRPVGMWLPHGAGQEREWPRESHGAPGTFVHWSPEDWGLGQEIRDVRLSCPARLSLCLATWGWAGLGFRPTGVLNVAATLGWAWDLCSPNLYQVKAPKLEGWDAELWGPGKVLDDIKPPERGYRTVWGKFSLFLASGKSMGTRVGTEPGGGAGLVKLLACWPRPQQGLWGAGGRGCLGSLFCPPDGWATESQGLKFDGRPSPTPACFCGSFLVSALAMPLFAVWIWVSVPGSLCRLLSECWFWT